VWQELMGLAIACDLPHAAAMCAHMSQGLYHSLQAQASCQLRSWGAAAAAAADGEASADAGPTLADASAADRALSEQLSSVQNGAGALLAQCAAVAAPTAAFESAAAAWVRAMLRDMPHGCVAACIVPAPALYGQCCPQQACTADALINVDTPLVVCRVSAIQGPIVAVLPVSAAAASSVDGSEEAAGEQQAAAAAPTPARVPAQTSTDDAAAPAARAGRNRRVQTAVGRAAPDEDPPCTAQQVVPRADTADKACGLGRVGVSTLLGELARVRDDSAASMATAAALSSQEEKAQWWKVRSVQTTHTTWP
jgi:hypothetical protein